MHNLRFLTSVYAEHSSLCMQGYCEDHWYIFYLLQGLHLKETVGDTEAHLPVSLSRLAQLRYLSGKEVPLQQRSID